MMIICFLEQKMELLLNLQTESITTMEELYIANGKHHAIVLKVKIMLKQQIKRWDS